MELVQGLVVFGFIILGIISIVFIKEGIKGFKDEDDNSV